MNKYERIILSIFLTGIYVWSIAITSKVIKMETYLNERKKELVFPNIHYTTNIDNKVNLEIYMPKQ